MQFYPKAVDKLLDIAKGQGVTMCFFLGIVSYILIVYQILRWISLAKKQLFR